MVCFDGNKVVHIVYLQWVVKSGFDKLAIEPCFFLHGLIGRVEGLVSVQEEYCVSGIK